MSLLKELMDAKQFGLESENIERSAYAGHAFESEMLEIDSVVSIFDIGTEGELYTDIELAPIFAAYGMEAEDGRELVDFTKEFEGLGLEAASDKIKATASKAGAFIKKIGKIIVGFVKRVINIIVNKNLALKKYGKVIGELLKKLDEKTFKDAEKKIKIHDLDGLSALVDAAAETTNAKVQAMTKTVKSAKKWDALYNTVMDDLNELVGNDVAGKTVEAIEATIKEKKIIAHFNTIIEKCEPSEAEMTCANAKSKLTSLAKGLDGKLNENIEVQKALREYASALDKKVTELTTADALDNYAEEAARNTATEQYKVLQKMGSIIAQAQAAHTKLFKHTTRCLGLLISDIRKTIGA